MQQQKLSAVLWSSLIDILFISVWLFVGVASSIWVSLFAPSRDITIQSITAQIWQTLWILSGLVLSVSYRAVTGAILGAIMSLILSIEVGGFIGFVAGFLLSILSTGRSQDLVDKLHSALTVGVFGAIFAAFCLVIFIGTFITFGGATIGFMADAFGRVHLYEKLLDRFKIISHSTR